MRLLPLAILVALSAPALAFYDRHDSPLEYLDLTNAEVVGDIAGQTYDVQQSSHFVGNQSLSAVLPNGGLGLRVIVRPKLGLRLSFEGNVGFGRLLAVDGPFASYSAVTRGEVLTGIGYEVTLARILTLHTATIGGVDITELDAAGARAAALTAGTDGASPPSLHLEAIGFRLGQQVGLHVQVANQVALYADGTVDWDGQWRVRAGVSVGAPRQLSPPGISRY